MALTREQEKKLLGTLLVVLVLLVAWRILTAEEQRTAPHTYPPGSVASSPVRRGIATPGQTGDPLTVFLDRRYEKFPGVKRDLFRMADPAPRPVAKPKPVEPPPPPPVPEKTPEEIAADLSRADLSRFRFLGYLTEKDNTLFLSKDGELFIVRSGDRVLRNYVVKDTGKDYVVLLDTITKVEVRVELSGGAEPGYQPPPPAPQPGPPQYPYQTVPPPPFQRPR